MNNQLNGFNVLLNPPFFYTNSQIDNNPKKTQFQLTTNSEGINNLICPVIPIIFTQPNHPNKPVIIPNNIISNQQPPKVICQIINGQLIPIQSLEQYNIVPNNQSAFNNIITKDDKDNNRLNIQYYNTPSNQFFVNKQNKSLQNNILNVNQTFNQKEFNNNQKNNFDIYNKQTEYFISQNINDMKMENNKNNNGKLTDKKPILDNIEQKKSFQKEIGKELEQNKILVPSLSAQENNCNSFNFNNKKSEIDKIPKTETQISNSKSNLVFNININNLSNAEEIQFSPSSEKKSKDKKKYYRCSFKDCNKVFPKECNLKDHIRTHTGEKPYKCSFQGCQKSFSQHGNLKKHEKVHYGDKKYYCPYPNCGKKFSASYNLTIHYRCHTGERPYKCCFPGCQRSFYDKGNLKYHEKTMHLEESMEYPYSCEHMNCNAKFRTEKEKLEHHCNMEPICLKERKELIKLVTKYKKLLSRIIKNKNINPNKNEKLISLKKDYEEIQSKLIDKKLFVKYLGVGFDNECNDVKESDSEKNEGENINDEENDNINEENEFDENEISKKNVSINK